jgi:hypothetical protein
MPRRSAMSSSILFSLVVLLFSNWSLALGINCRGSGVCPLATFENKQDVNILRALRNEIYSTNLPLDTTFANGEHITCVGNSIAISIGPEYISLSGGIPAGAVCAFAQNLGDGYGLTLEQIRVLADAVVAHDCDTCGSVPISFLNGENGNVDDGELTFNFVSDENCTGNCIMSGQNDGTGQVQTPTQVVEPITATVGMTNTSILHS